MAAGEAAGEAAAAGEATAAGEAAAGEAGEAGAVAGAAVGTASGDAEERSRAREARVWYGVWRVAGYAKWCLGYFYHFKAEMGLLPF